ncbi:phosphoenolpyruvate-protein phosphotransferase [Alicyclobacillus acidoterrestris]|uniref:phosphoenolpyruvate--protein phosphotransferase n=1 Tax=Alicyclobacillus suci TaxID=2816080 RepID=UPI0011975EDB|nr:phosphoenolpyruvate--protein phosphotransferase [Alicyclobacillus suci]GEO27785.1 phosphoenolpyruvate-protein phosphotransferase [Alicyclobacillus acidoterrestris]
MGRRYHGVAASDGIAIAPVFVVNAAVKNVEKREDVTVEQELSKLEDAIARTKAELQQLYETANQKLGASHAQIFVAHLQILDDPEFVGAIQSTMQTEHVNVEYALTSVTSQLVAIFEQMDDEYMRQRSSDIKDVSQRVLGHLQGTSRASLAALEEPVILVAEDLTPSDTVVLDKNLVHAFVTDVGGRTSHSAIMARSLGIPAVVGLGEISQAVEPGMTVIVNGLDGEVIVDPTPDELAMYRRRMEEDANQRQQLQALRFEPTVTTDGHQVELAGNIGGPADVDNVQENGGEGIGLFRSEFLYMNRNAAPTEEEQFQAYREVAERMAGKPVVIRTLDVGGDKEIPYLDLPKESNPFLGYRAIRVCLDTPELFKTQLRAILRASHYGHIKLMFPMISNVMEIRQAKQLLKAVQSELRDASIPFDEQMEIGIMVEIPASAVIADVLAQEVDFFSIGTNDLIQYTMACDRMNDRITHLYQPYHPAILRLVKMVVDGAHQHGKWVGMCGEMAGDLTAVPILLGLGLDEFSMSGGSILRVRQLIRDLSYERAQALADEALKQDSQQAVEELVAKWSSH